jgi:hypothetical protein
MCDVCPDSLETFSFLLGISFIISFVILILTRNFRLSLLWLSIFSNAVSILDGQFFFLVYGISWAMYPIIFVWPILNIIFIILYVCRTKDKQD